MAFTCGFYNSVGHDRKYDAVQHGQIFDGIITDGIYATYLKAMVVKASENANEVIVQPGRAWFNHTWSYNDADYPVTAPDPEVVLDRIDTLVLDVNSEDAVRDNQFLWVQGTPTSQTPEPPALIRSATHNQYPLCDVYRKAGTTQIYAADITNRVGTSDCPFVTGVLEGINIDDLLAQWDDEFHTWEDATKTSFEGWMINQQQVYTAWFNALKTQMAGDVADVEEWIETIKDIIDSETATHLQMEIDEINEMLPAGSHITVTTTNTELYLRNVTITDEVGHSATAKFDSSGVAVFESFPYVGTLTISSTDGQQTAIGTLNTPYFGRYTTAIRFWVATLSFNLDSAFGGSVITIKDSLETTIGTVTLNSSGDGTFDVESAGTYTCSMVYGGQTMTQSVNVTQETTYSVSFIPTGATATPVNDIQTWLHCANIWGKSYTTIAQVLADASAVQTLMASSNAVDYMVRSTNWVSSVCANSNAMTYIGANDYCANELLANSTWCTAICNSTYFESVLNVKVPTMTSDTTPYGKVTYHSQLSGDPLWRAFNTSYSLGGLSTANDTSAWVAYTFPTKMVPKKVVFKSYSGSTYGTSGKNYGVKASNDNFATSDTLLETQTIPNTTSPAQYSYLLNNPNNIAYNSLKLDMTGGTYDSRGYRGVGSLNFYGRSQS